MLGSGSSAESASPRGVIYGLLAYLAFDIAASGSSPAQTSGSGALQEVANQPGAPFLAGDTGLRHRGVRDIENGSGIHR